MCGLAIGCPDSCFEYFRWVEILSSYTLMHTQKSTTQREKKNKNSRTVRLVAARSLCKFNQHFPHRQRNPLSNWPQTKRSRIKLIPFTSWLRNRKFSLVTLGWSFSKVSMTRAAIAMQGQTATLCARKTSHDVKLKDECRS